MARDKLAGKKIVIVFVEELGPRPYFPLPIRPIWWALHKKRAVLRDPESLLTLICRMRKKA